MMKRIRIFTFLFLLPLVLSAQKVIPIEPAILECQYDFFMVKDTTHRDNKSQDRMMLRIGKSVSQFFNYNAFLGDSLANDPQGKKQWAKMMLQAIEQRDYNTMPGSKTMGNYIYKNYPQGKITTTDELLVDFFRYEEEYVPQAWQINDSVKQILGYTCQKAACYFRGRQWTAWFSPDIPLSDGPWKFNGLPGLILEAYDTHKDYHYTAIGIKQNDLPSVTFYNFDEKKFIETNRISFLKAKRKLWDTNDPNREIQAATGIDLSDGKASAPRKKRHNYEFIECDYR